MGALLRTIHEKNPFDVPPTFVRRRFDQLIEEEHYRYSMMYGRKAADGLMRNGQYQASLIERCKRDVINAFLLLELAKKEGLEATDEAVEKEIGRRAEEAGRKPLAIRAELERHNRLDDLKEQLLRDAVEEWLRANNTVSYVAPKPHEHHEHVHGPDCDHDHEH
jgi:trigger factor